MDGQVDREMKGSMNGWIDRGRQNGKDGLVSE